MTVSRTGMPTPGSFQLTSAAVDIIRYPTITNAGAVASGGITPAIGEKNIANRNSAPVTTDASPVRPPSDTPDALSMNVVFDDDDVKPPNAAASESTNRTRFIPGSRP